MENIESGKTNNTGATENEREQLLIKLGYIPKGELVKLINNNFSFKKAKLIELISNFDGTKTKDPFKKISSYPKKKILEFYNILNPLPKKEIEELFSEYVYTNRPSLFFCYINSITEKSFYDKPKLDIKKILDEQIKTLNNSINGSSKFPDIRNISLIELNKTGGILELEVEYESKIEYINPMTREIKHVYSLENGLVWISIKNKAVILNLNDINMWNYLVKPLEKILGASIMKYNVPKQIGDKLFGFDTIKKANYIESDPGNMEYDEKKSVSDTQFSKKRESKLLNERCDRTSAMHSIDMLQRKTTINVSDNGKIKIYDHLKKSNLKKWAFENLIKISEIVSNISPKDIKTKLNSIDISNSKSLKNMSGIAQEIFKELYVGIRKIFDDGIDIIQLNNNTKSIVIGLKDFFIPLFQPKCDNCGEINYQHSCGAINSIYLDGFSRPKCSECGREIKNILTELKCPNEDSHKFDSNLFESLTIISNNNFIKLVESFSKELGLKLNINKDYVVMIKNRALSLRKITGKNIYHFNEIDKFKEITALNQIPNDIRKIRLDSLSDSTEKCPRHSSEDCNNCMINQKGLCIQRLVAGFVDSPHLHSHSGSEYGDMKFNLTFGGIVTPFIGVAKSCKNNLNKKLTLKNNEGTKLLSQVLELLLDSRVQGINVISSAIIDDRLSETLKTLANYYRKKIFFIEREEIIRLLHDYLSPLEGTNEFNYWYED